ATDETRTKHGSKPTGRGRNGSGAVSKDFLLSSLHHPCSVRVSSVAHFFRSLVGSAARQGGSSTRRTRGVWSLTLYGKASAAGTAYFFGTPENWGGLSHSSRLRRRAAASKIGGIRRVARPSGRRGKELADG